MPSLEQQPAETNIFAEATAIESEDTESRSTSLIYGSAEMLESKSRLAMNRLISLGAAANHLTLELHPVERPAEA